MTRMVTNFLRYSRLLSDESGATAIEYAFLCVLIAVAIITALALVGTNLSTFFSTLDTQI